MLERLYFWGLLMLRVGRVLGYVYGCSHRKRLIRITTPTSSNEPTVPPHQISHTEAVGSNGSIDGRPGACLRAH